MTQPPTGPPQEPPPRGHYPQPSGPPPKRGRGWEIFGGVVVGGILAVVFPLLSLAIADRAGFGGSHRGSAAGARLGARPLVR